LAVAFQVRWRTGQRCSRVGTTAAKVGTAGRAAVILAAGTGLRQGEVFGLTLPNVQMLRRRLVVEQQVVTPATAEGEVRLGPLKTPASYRAVPLPEVVIDALAEHLARYPATHEWDLVFTTDTGGPVRRNRSAEFFRKGATAAGLGTHVTFHALRHHYASLLIGAGCSVKAVQDALGHATAAETLDTYSHLWPADEERTRSAVDAAHRETLADPVRTPLAP
jgi:integrase